MSSVIPHWQRFIVPQRRPASGCIPTGYEMLLRAAGAQGIDLESFQDDFDLDKGRREGEEPKNNFDSVAAAVRERYPKVKFESRRYDIGEGKNKLEFVEQSLQSLQPVLVSLPWEPFDLGKNAHIMLVLDATTEKLLLLHYVDADGIAKKLIVSKADFVGVHDEYERAGHDVAYLVSWQ